MPINRVTAFLNEKYHPKRCCWCLSLKLGTDIIGILEIISSLIVMCLFKIDFDIGDGETSTEHIFGSSSEMIMTANILRSIWIAIATLLIAGNNKGMKKLMVPYVYMKFISVIWSIITMFIVMLVHFFFLKFIDGIIVLIYGILTFVLNGYYWYIVQCRIIEIEENLRPETKRASDDPEIPAYGKAQDISAQGAGGTSARH